MFDLCSHAANPIIRGSGTTQATTHTRANAPKCIILSERAMTKSSLRGLLRF